MNVIETLLADTSVRVYWRAEAFSIWKVFFSHTMRTCNLINIGHYNIVTKWIVEGIDTVVDPSEWNCKSASKLGVYAHRFLIQYKLDGCFDDNQQYVVYLEFVDAMKSGFDKFYRRNYED